MSSLRRLAPALVVAVVLAGGAYIASQNSDDEPDASTDSPLDPAPDPVAPTAGEGVTVERVADGDSFVVRLASGDTSEVRLIGINAPDFHECLDQESRAALEDLLGGGDVVLVPDVTDRDQYDRLLRYVQAGGVFVNQELVERGLAITTSTEPDIAREADLDAAQARARAAGLGIWNPDACGIAASTAVAIVRVEADPPGRDEYDLNGEYVVVANSGPSPVDMTGWKLRDDSTRNRYSFPDGFTLDAGRQVTIHVGQGDDTADDLYWGQRHPVWDNTRDMALLLDPRGNVASYADVG